MLHQKKSSSYQNDRKERGSYKVVKYTVKCKMHLKINKKVSTFYFLSTAKCSFKDNTKLLNNSTASINACPHKFYQQIELSIMDSLLIFLI